jgi:hypothetical protein
MKNPVEITANTEPLSVLLIGNNPIDMSSALEKINQIKGRKIVTEIAFDIKSVMERLMNFSPNFILIDDNIGRTEFALTVDTLSKTRKTKNTPITVLKNSNYRESSSGSRIMDFILKQNLSTDTLYTTIKNSLRLKRTQELLLKAYAKRRGQLARLAF